MTQGTGAVKDLAAAAAAVRLVAMDVDGTLTDGGINIGNEGECYKRFHCRDGLAISASVRHGLPVALITGRDSRIVRLRASELHLPAEDVLTGVSDKGTALRELLTRYGITAKQVAYLGDDLNDLPVLTQVGLAACPADAVADVRSRCHVVLPHAGGQGAARDLLEFILKAKGQWEALVQEYINMGQGDRQ
ncbi:MAG: KdsC family phosphatase [Succiniclasticum sp.]